MPDSSVIMDYDEWELDGDEAPKEKTKYFTVKRDFLSSSFPLLIMTTKNFALMRCDGRRSCDEKQLCSVIALQHFSLHIVRLPNSNRFLCDSRTIQNSISRQYSFMRAATNSSLAEKL